MTLIGYTMMCEQAGPKQLVRDVALAEQAGFDFAVISDHYFPWLDSQGHSTVRVERARRGRAGDRPHSLDDVRDVPDPALSPRGRRPEGGDDAIAVRRSVHPR